MGNGGRGEGGTTAPKSILLIGPCAKGKKMRNEGENPVQNDVRHTRREKDADVKNHKKDNRNIRPYADGGEHPGGGEGKPSSTCRRLNSWKYLKNSKGTIKPIVETKSQAS